MFHVCKQCGKGFEAATSREHFCSLTCKNRYHYSRKQSVETRICEECKKEFLPKTKRSRYCCRACAERNRHRRDYYAQRNRISEKKTSDQKAEG